MSSLVKCIGMAWHGLRLMNKVEAIKYLEISQRTLDRLISQGRLKATYIRSKTGPQIELNEDDVRRLKEELEMPVHRSVVSNQGEIEESANMSNDTFLARLINSSQCLDLLNEISHSMQAIALHYTNVRLSEKILLTIPEAVIISGLSKAGIKRSLVDGTLPAVKEGGRWKIRPEDLREYVCKKVDKISELN